MRRLMLIGAVVALALSCKKQAGEIRGYQADPGEVKQFIADCIARRGEVVNVEHYSNGKYSVINPSCIWKYKQPPQAKPVDPGG